jgi:hypothetical protein
MLRKKPGSRRGDLVRLRKLRERYLDRLSIMMEGYMRHDGTGRA